MVAHPLHEVAHQLGVEERHGELEQLDEEVAHQRYVDAHGDMQQQPAADKVDGRTAEGQHQLAEQYQPDEAEILVLDAHVYDGLCEEWQHELQQAAHRKAENHLPKIAFVFPDVAKEEAERPWILFAILAVAFCLGRVEGGRGLKQHGYPLVLPTRPRAYPMVPEFIAAVAHQPLARVGDIEELSLAHLVEHHEVVLVPMEDAGKRSLRQIVDGCPHADRMQPHVVGGLTDSQQRDTLRRDMADLREPFHRDLSPIVQADHLEACHTALHRVELFDEGEPAHLLQYYWAGLGLLYELSPSSE